jgi:hypothetical protein
MILFLEKLFLDRNLINRWTFINLLKQLKKLQLEFILLILIITLTQKP